MATIKERQQKEQLIKINLVSVLEKSTFLSGQTVKTENEIETKTEK